MAIDPRWPTQLMTRRRVRSIFAARSFRWAAGVAAAISLSQSACYPYVASAWQPDGAELNPGDGLLVQSSGYSWIPVDQCDCGINFGGIGTSPSFRVYSPYINGAGYYIIGLYTASTLEGLTSAVAKLEPAAQKELLKILLNILANSIGPPHSDTAGESRGAGNYKRRDGPRGRHNRF